MCLKDKKLSDRFCILKEKQAESVLFRVQNGDSFWMSDWKLVSPGRKLLLLHL